MRDDGDLPALSSTTDPCRWLCGRSCCGSRDRRIRGPSTDATPIAQGCPGGEEADQFTGNCVPHTVPNAGASPYTTLPGNPDIPTVGGIPCAGHNSGQCIGLAEEQQAMTVTPPPAPVVSHSPTVTN